MIRRAAASSAEEEAVTVHGRVSRWRRSAYSGDLLSMLKVGVTGFGGGSALIPLFEDELVCRRGRLSQAEFTRQTIVASVTPGALPVKLAALAGWAGSGAWLALAMAVLVAVPGAVGTMALISVVASHSGAVRYVELTSVGITAFIVVLLLHYIFKVLTGSARVPVAIMALTFVTTGAAEVAALAAGLVGRSWRPDLPSLGAVQVIGIGLAVVVVRALVRWIRPRQHPTSAATVSSRRGSWRSAVLMAGVGGAAVVAVGLVHGQSVGVLGLVALSTVTSFGGGEAYVAVADGFFVQGGHVAADVFYNQLVPIANALPGPILVKLAAAIGFTAGSPGGAAMGWLVGGAASVVAITACSAIALVMIGAYERASHSPVVREIGEVFLPVIAGLLATVSVSMLNASANVAIKAGLAAPAVLWASLAGIVIIALLRRRRVHDLVLIAGSGLVAVAVLGVAS